MKKTISLCLFSVFSLLCNAQQQIIFTNFKTHQTVTFTLPQKVVCTELNGYFKEVVLEKVVGDSLFFSDLKTKDKIYRCKYADLKSIQFHNKNDQLIKLGVFIFGMSSVVLASVSIISLGAIILNGNRVSDNINYYFGLFGAPLSIYYGILAYFCNENLAKPFSESTWKLTSENILPVN